MSPRKYKPADPTATPTSEHSTQVASGLGGGQGGPAKATGREPNDVLNRSAEERYETPRRYEESEEREEGAPAVPNRPSQT